MLVSVLATLAMPLAAQSLAEQLQKAPPDVETRLRQRIAAFYQAHVDRKFRQAEQYVAEDTKDFFYEKRKPEILKFEVKEIQYSDEFKKAKATVVCEQRIMLPGFGGKVMGVPVPSYWRIENGDWFYYVDQQRNNLTPFGQMKGGEGPGTGDIPNLSSGPDVRTVQSLVKAESNRVELSPGQESKQVKIMSAMPGSITLRLDVPAAAGLTASLDQTELKARGATVLRVSTDPAKPMRQATRLSITVQPTGQVIHVLVSYKGPSSAKN